jgi:hypothetical protein
MKNNEITVSYSGEALIDHLGKQYDGCLCTNIRWDKNKGNVETWQPGAFDPEIYPVMKISPFRLWQNT